MAETKRRRNLGMNMPKKQLGAEALIDLHRRLSISLNRCAANASLFRRSPYPIYERNLS